MTLTIPSDGLAEVRRIWAGRGSLWTAADAVEDDRGVTWTPRLARRRASRVLVEFLRPALLAWPASTRTWLESLPAQSVRQRIFDTSPGSGVDWVASRQFGWPPREFHHRRRTRVADSLLVTATRWTIETLATVVGDADTVDATALGDDARGRHDAARRLLDLPPLDTSHAAEPARGDLAALRASGRPWSSVAAVASWLRILDHDPAYLAAMALDPDPALADRLFHVAVLGTTLRALRDIGWMLGPTGLPGAPDRRPVFQATDAAGIGWDLWFEEAGAWTYYGAAPPYPLAVSGITGTGGPLGADLALFSRDGRAVLIECKFSPEPTYVGRNGYEQLLAYMVEARTGLASRVAGILVGPNEVVCHAGKTKTAIGDVHVTNPDALPDALSLFLTYAPPGLL